jgi:hypothetical protein
MAPSISFLEGQKTQRSDKKIGDREIFAELQGRFPRSIRNRKKLILITFSVQKTVGVFV